MARKSTATGELVIAKDTYVTIGKERWRIIGEGTKPETWKLICFRQTGFKRLPPKEMELTEQQIQDYHGQAQADHVISREMNRRDECWAP